MLQWPLHIVSLVSTTCTGFASLSLSFVSLLTIRPSVTLVEWLFFSRALPQLNVHSVSPIRPSLSLSLPLPSLSLLSLPSLSPLSLSPLSLPPLSLPPSLPPSFPLSLPPSLPPSLSLSLSLSLLSLPLSLSLSLSLSLIQLSMKSRPDPVWNSLWRMEREERSGLKEKEGKSNLSEKWIWLEWKRERQGSETHLKVPDSLSFTPWDASNAWHFNTF